MTGADACGDRRLEPSEQPATAACGTTDHAALSVITSQVRKKMLRPVAYGGTEPVVPWSSADNQRVDFFIPEPSEEERKTAFAHAKQKKLMGSKTLGRFFGAGRSA